MKLQFDDFYRQHLDLLDAYQLAMSTMYVDQNTIAPKKGAMHTNKAMSILGSQAFAIENNPETIARIREYAETLPEGSLEKKEVSKRLKEIAKTENIPADVYEKYMLTQHNSETTWHEAKEKSDYSLFKDSLKDLMEQRINLVKYDPEFNGENTYDLLLEQYEEGTNQALYDEFFETIKKELIPVIEKVNAARPIDTAPIQVSLSEKRQAEFADQLLAFMQADPERVYLSTTEHPFTDFLGADDVRITTHYYPDTFLSAILSTVHEYGHALYGLQMDPDFAGTMLVNSVGSAAHESQSRFLENHIGRSESFWKGLYPKLIAAFPEFKDLSPEELTEMINVSVPGLVRTEADELTYPLHILVRYEIEKMIADGTLDYDRLPEIWADKYEEYLGVRPENDREGVLQDMHWSAGDLGYFPTYALGSAYAAQLYEAMAKELNVEKALEEGDFKKITDWLEKNVHHYGASKSMKEIVEEVSGKPFDPTIYTNYLKDKYKKLYHLDDEKAEEAEKQEA